MKFKEYISKKYLSVIFSTFILIGAVNGLIYILDFGIESIFTGQFIQSVFADIFLFTIFLKSFLLCGWIKYKFRRK